MNPWFRFYSEVVDDPKVQRLPLLLFRAWVNLLCVANKNGGILPEMANVAYSLHVTESRAETITRELCEAGLFDKTDGVFSPHNWHGRQFQSDSSTERVKRFRNGQRNVPATASETVDETSHHEKEESFPHTPFKEEKSSPLPETETDPETETEGNTPISPLLVFGEFGWVRITADQHGSLKALLNGKFEEYVARFDGWVQEAPTAKANGVRRKDRNPYASIQNWHRKDLQENHGPQARSKTDLNAEAGARALAKFNSAHGSGG